jgi:hypothetical protein
VLRFVKLTIDRTGEEGVPERENVLFGVWNWINRKRQRDRILSGSWAGESLEGGPVV